MAAIKVPGAGPVDFDELARELEQGLGRHGLERPKVTIAVVDRLERDGGPAKLKRFVPLASAAPAIAGARR